ncbi:unnamed protein product [Parajaminaea phylloscopi]
MRAITRIQSWLDRLPEDVPHKDGLRSCNELSEQACFLWLSAHVKVHQYSYLKAHHSALAWHFQTQFNCSATKSHGWHKVDGQWKGNPVYSQRYVMLLQSAQREGAKAPVRHALPITYPLLARVLTTLFARQKSYEAQSQVLSGERTRIEFMSAFFVIAYRLWLRCEETCNLTWGNIDPGVRRDPQTGSQYLSVTLTWRKTNQFDANKSNVYQLHHLPGRPLANAIAVISRWQQYWEWAVRRPPRPDDLVFPGWRKASGHLNIRQALKSSDINSLLAGISELETGAEVGDYRYTSHSFRRGGAQDAVIYAADYGEAPKALHFCKWWGGWDPSESNQTIERYILNEVSAREDYFGDMENPLHAINRRALWAGGAGVPALQAVASIQDAVREMQTAFNEHSAHQSRQLEYIRRMGCQQGLPAPPVTSPDLQCLPAPAAPGRGASDAGVASPVSMHPGSPSGSSYHQTVNNFTTNVIINVQGHPVMQRIPTVTTIQQVVQQWEHGDPQNGLTALKDWVPAMRQKGKGGNASLFANRKKLYDAYAKRGHSVNAFHQAYGTNKTLSQYIKAIDAEARSGANEGI